MISYFIIKIKLKTDMYFSRVKRTTTPPPLPLRGPRIESSLSGFFQLCIQSACPCITHDTIAIHCVGTQFHRQLNLVNTQIEAPLERCGIQLEWTLQSNQRENILGILVEQNLHSNALEPSPVFWVYDGIQTEPR